MSKIKMKSLSGAKKRFRRTKSGLVKVRSAHRNHILGKIKTAVKRIRRGGKILVKADQKRVDNMLVGG